MGKRDLFVTDFDYMFVESDVKDITASLGSIAEEFCTLTSELAVGLEGSTAEQIKVVYNHMVAINNGLVVFGKSLDQKFQGYVLDVDEIDDFIY